MLDDLGREAKPRYGFGDVVVLRWLPRSRRSRQPEMPQEALPGARPSHPTPSGQRTEPQGPQFFSRAEQTLLAALQRPGFNIAGLRRADLLPLLGQSSPATLSRQLARLRHLAVIKRVLGTYRYYLTRAGRAAIAAGCRLTEHTIIPALA